jgi:catechol 2,3-dioxygenase-like lactoylglutathione lyase family enzyme
MEICIVVVCLWAEDVPAATHFYRNVIGLALQDHVTVDHPHFDLDGTSLVIRKGRPAPPPHAELRFPVIALAVPDLVASVGRLRSHGVAMPWGVETNASGRWVMFHDPAGNLIELVEFTHTTGDGL